MSHPKILNHISWLHHQGALLETLAFYAIRKSLREVAERLADKYEEAKEKQEDIMTRSVGHVTV